MNLCGTKLPKCIVCGLVLTEENAYRKEGSKTGLHSRCKKHHIKYQMQKREKRREGKGFSLIEIKVTGEGSIKIKYNPRRQIVDIRGLLKFEEAARFWIEVFDKKKTITRTKRDFIYRISHVSRILWEEATMDLQFLEEYQEEKENAIHDRKSARRRDS